MPEAAVVAVILGENDKSVRINLHLDLRFLTLCARVGIDFREILGRNGQAALPAVAARIGGKRGGKQLNRLPVRRGFDGVFHNVSF